MPKLTLLLTESFELLKKGSVIDFGSGDGSNIAFLRGKGFSVRGIEKNYGETVEDYIAKTTETQDNFISFYTLHFLNKSDMQKAYSYMKDKTTSGGVNMIIDFTVDGPLVSDTFFKPNELKDIYSDWEILRYEEKFVTTYNGSQQMAAFIVAKKP